MKPTLPDGQLKKLDDQTAVLNRSQFILVQILWILLGGMGLITFGLFSLEWFFIVSFVGFLSLVAIAAPMITDRLKIVIAVGVVIFIFIVLRRIAIIVEVI